MFCRAVVVADAGTVCAAQIDASRASVHISSDEILLAVCEDASISTWAIADLVKGTTDKVLHKWSLGPSESIKQARHALKLQ